MGGLDKIGYKEQNDKHGKASFYVIPMEKLEPFFVATGKKPVSDIEEDKIIEDEGSW